MKVFLDASFLIYLNIGVEDERLDKLFKRALSEEAYTDVLAIDELLYVSKRKYRVPYEETVAFIDDVILPAVEILPVGLQEYLKMRSNVLKYNLKPSDAIHLAVMENNGIQAIITEDADFQRTPVKVIWIDVR